MNLEPVCYKSEREKYVLTYIWNLEKWYGWTYLQSKNRDTNIENGLLDPTGEGEGGTNRESTFDI